MCYSPEKEVWIRKTALVERIASVEGMQIPGAAVGANVIANGWKWTSKEDFAATMSISGAANIHALEVKFAFIQYLNIIDTGDGTNKCPVIQVNYNILLAWQYQNVRSGGSKSTDDLIALSARIYSELTMERRLDAETRIFKADQPQPKQDAKTIGVYLPDDKVKLEVINLRVVVEVR